MFGDTEIQPAPSTPQQTPSPVSNFNSNIPKPKTPIFPIIFGFLIVLIMAAGIGMAYYKNMLTTTSTSSPTPSSSTSASTLPNPSIEPADDATGSSLTPKTSPSSTPKPSSTVKPTPTPVSVIKPLPSPTATPTPFPTLDIRFGNPSANIKQTYDDGSGAGRVINREYTSLQFGQFDEVPSLWSPKVTVCFHFVANETLSGKDLKYNFFLNDKQESEGNLSQYDKLEAGRLYDFCRDTTTGLGKHTARLQLNADKSLKESNYNNGTARVDWENLADNIPPNFTLLGPNNEGENGTCLFPQYVSDNVSTYANLNIEQKVDSQNWTKFPGDRYCFKGESGESHTYSIRITDQRGNVSQQDKSFVLY